MTYDEHSLISWLESQALEAHNHNCEKCEYRMNCATIEPDQVCEKIGEEKAYNKVLAYLRNTRAPQLHRKLMEKR